MSDLLKVFAKQILVGIKESPRMYFSPINGAIKAIYYETVGDDRIHDDCDKNHVDNKKKKRKAA